MLGGDFARADRIVRPNEISVVLQGPVVGKPSEGPASRLTKRALESIRHNLPGAEVILSTWSGSDVTGLSFDVLIENQDPGAVTYEDFPNQSNNVNRQIVTAKNGISAATRPFALKLRTDMLMSGLGFCHYFNRYPARSDYSILESKVVASTLFSRIPGIGWQWPYHPSDWFHFGQSRDVFNIWNIPLAPEPQTTRWFIGRDRPPNDQSIQSMSRYTPEQYIWLSFIRKYREVACDYQWDIDHLKVEDSNKFIASNLILISPDQAGLTFAKYKIENKGSKSPKRTCYSHRLWREDFRRYCEGRKVAQIQGQMNRILRLATIKIIEQIETARTWVARKRGRSIL